MTLRARVIEAPAALVDLPTVKQHLRVTADDEDTLIQAYIDAACAHIDGPGGWLDRAVGVQTLEVRADDFEGDGCETFDLPYPDLIDVVSVKYLDVDGAEQTVSSSDYAVTAGQVLRVASGAAWPEPLDYSDAVRIRYRAGYVTDATADPLVPAIPGAIIAAVLLMVGDLYDNRGSTAEGSWSAIPMSTTVERLLQPYRIWAL